MVLLSDKIIKALNYRIEQEEYSSQLYDAIGRCMGYKGYLGAEKLFADYAKDEKTHASWSYEYQLSLDIKPITPAIKALPMEFEGLPEVIELAFKHELEITRQCKELAKLCMDEGDYMTFGLAQKYLNEQVEEIEKVTTLLDILDAFGTSKESLFLFDNHLKTLV
jgi:ferritin